MRIVFDCREETRNVTGIGTYVRNLAGEIRARKASNPHCLCLPERAGEPMPPRIRTPKEQFVNLAHHLYWKQIYLPARTLKERAHVLVCMDPVAPIFCPSKMAIIIYDLVFATGSAQSDAWTRYWRLFVPLAAHRADCIFTVSAATRMKIVDRLGVDAGKVKLFRTGVAGHFRPMHWTHEEKENVRKEFGLPSSFILSVGAHDPRRNVRRLLDAYKDLARRRKITHKLVVVGPTTAYSGELLQYTEELGLASEVLYAGYVPNERLHLYYNLADVYVYPSLEEGFGLTPLEAMACGCPVVTSNLSSLPEVVGDAALLVDPYDAAEISSALERMLFDVPERDEWISRGIARARRFTWNAGMEDLLRGCKEMT